MDGTDPEGGGFPKDLSGGLWPGQADQEDNGFRIGRGSDRFEFEFDSGVGNPSIPGFSLESIDNPGVEWIARFPSEDFPYMNGPRIRKWERSLEFAGLEQDEIHGGNYRSWANRLGQCRTVPAVP